MNFPNVSNQNQIFKKKLKKKDQYIGLIYFERRITLITLDIRAIIEIVLALIAIGTNFYFGRRSIKLSKDFKFIGDSSFSIFRDCLTLTDVQGGAIDQNNRDQIIETRRGIAELSRHGASTLVNFYRTYRKKDPNYISKEDILRIGRREQENNSS